MDMIFVLGIALVTLVAIIAFQASRNNNDDNQ